MLKIMKLIFYFIFILSTAFASEGGHGGGSSSGSSSGGGNSFGGSADSPSNHLPPVMPLQMKPEDILNIKSKSIKSSKNFESLKELKEAKKRAKNKSKIVNDHIENIQKQDTAFTDLKRADINVKVAKTVGQVSAAASAIVGVIATGGAAATIATISVASDGVGAAAGSLSESYHNNKSATKAIKDASLAGIRRGIFSKYIAVSKVGGKATSALASYGSGVFYDYADNAAKNLKAQ